jgi:hypothetical protein
MTRKCENCGKPVDDNGSIACEGCEETEPTCLECGKWSPGWRTCEDCPAVRLELPADSMSLIANAVVYRGRIEADQLTRSLLDAAAVGRRPNCSDPLSRYLWLSDEESDRREAVKLCSGCVVLDPCGQAADARQERWFVWGACAIPKY